MLQHSVSQPALHISDPNAATTVSTVVIIGTGLTGGQIGDIVLDGGALSGGWWQASSSPSLLSEEPSYGLLLPVNDEGAT